MPHLLTEYSKNLGAKPRDIYVNKHFYPIIPDNYVVIYNEKNTQSKTYDYFSLVVDLIKSHLDEKGLKTVVIGSGSQMTSRADYFYPNLTFRENAYILSKAKVFISVDNALTQYASFEGVPVVTLYGNTYPSITTPYWSHKNKKVDVEPEWEVKPSFSDIDPEDPINKIPAETVARSILKLLEGKGKYKIDFKTKRINKNKSFVVDVIPTNYVDMPVFKDQTINIRMDKGQVEEGAFFDYCLNHKCNIVVEDLVLKPEVLGQISNNIESIKIILNKIPDDIPKSYFQYFKKLGINILFAVRNKDILDQVRFQYFDQNVEYEKLNNKKPNDVDLGDKFFSFKTVIEGGNSYKSMYHWKNNVDKDDNIVDNASYWEELDYFYIYEQENN